MKKTLLKLSKKYWLIPTIILVTVLFTYTAFAVESLTPKATESYEEAVKESDIRYEAKLEADRIAYQKDLEWREARYAVCQKESFLAHAKLNDAENGTRPLSSQENKDKLEEKVKWDCAEWLPEQPLDPKLQSGNFTATTVGGIDEFLKVNGAEFVKEAGDLFRAGGLINKIKPEVIVCIAQADSSLGNALKTSYNLGNVGNNDRGDTVHYSNLETGINNIGLALNNQYMGGNTLIGQLSQGGRNNLGTENNCEGAPSPYKCYATSEFNWNKNVVACLQNIYQDTTIDENFEFRTL
jgi:hypothetical protein